MLGFAIVILILGFIGGTILRRHLREAKLLRLREMSHKERMMAMERDLPVPDADAGRIDSLLAGDRATVPGSDRKSGTSVHWVRLAALALGLTFLFGGVGVMSGLYLVWDPDASGTWPVGLIPVFIGTGLLVFLVLSKGLAEKINGERDSR